MAQRTFRRRTLAQARAQTEAVLSGASPEEVEALVKPKRRNRHIESEHGRALIKWRDRAKATRPEVAWLHHIPNGIVFGSEKKAGMMKAEGLTAGVLDYFLPVRKPIVRQYVKFTGEYMGSGLYIELKAPGLENHARGGMSEKQEEFATFVHGQGYVVALCYHWDQARQAVEAYLDGNPIPHLWSPPS